MFAAGVFAPVVKAIGEVIDRHVPGARPVLVDAGCGEGYYTKNVCPGRAMERIGFDLSKEAVKLAARGQSGASFLVADLANIPLAGGCADVLLDVFTPANYAEFARVLKPGGVLIKLWPRSGYLCQLLEAARGLLRHDTYDDSRVAEYLDAHARMLERRTITYTLPVDAALAEHLARSGNRFTAGSCLKAVPLCSPRACSRPSCAPSARRSTGMCRPGARCSWTRAAARATIQKTSAPAAT